MNYNSHHQQIAVNHPGWWRLIGRRAKHKLRSHPYLYVLRLLLLIALLSFAATSCGANHTYLLLAGSAYFLITLFRLTKPFNTKGEEVQDWAIAEQEHLTMQSLTGKNEEELEKLLEYHMKYGHIEEADKISQQLLAVVDNGPESPPVDNTIIAPAKKLPDWMN
jgi:hypothetical protein